VPLSCWRRSRSRSIASLAPESPRSQRATGRLRSGAARNWGLQLSALILIVAIATALTFVTPIDTGDIWLFFGLSRVIAAVRGDAGCEALAIPHAILDRRERTRCIAFAPLDSLEAARALRSRTASQ
jgi:hypothetical protein